MSEIYNRSMGFTYNERALANELASGTSGYDTISDSSDLTPISRSTVAEYRMSEELADIGVEFMLAEQQMAEVAVEHPKYTWHVGRILTERLEIMEKQGHPVDAEMYLEATQLAEEIVAANPEKDAEELTEVVSAMVGMIQAQQKMQKYELAA